MACESGNIEIRDLYVLVISGVLGGGTANGEGGGGSSVCDYFAGQNTFGHLNALQLCRSCEKVGISRSGSICPDCQRHYRSHFPF